MTRCAPRRLAAATLVNFAAATTIWSNSFAGFMTALSAALNGTMVAIDVAGGGQYDSAKNTFTATQIVVLLSNQPAPPGGRRIK